MSELPLHTAEHLLNATMVKMFICPRSRNAHIERKKCKCDYGSGAKPCVRRDMAGMAESSLPVTASQRGIFSVNPYPRYGGRNTCLPQSDFRHVSMTEVFFGLA